MRDLAKELEGFDGRWPASWRPKEGEMLIGRIIRYSEGPGRFGPVRTAIIERDDGTRASLWLSSMVLLDQFNRERPRVGERVGVKYLGKHPQKGYHRFTLVVDREEPAPDFSPLGGEEDCAPQPLKPTPHTTDTATPYADRVIRPAGSQRGRPPVSRQHARAAAPSSPPPHGDDEDPFCF